MFLLRRNKTDIHTGSTHRDVSISIATVGGADSKKFKDVEDSDMIFRSNTNIGANIPTPICIHFSQELSDVGTYYQSNTGNLKKRHLRRSFKKKLN